MGGANLRSKAAVCPRQRAISDLRPNPVGCTSESEVSREGYLIICAHESGQ